MEFIASNLARFRDWLFYHSFISSRLVPRIVHSWPNSLSLLLFNHNLSFLRWLPRKVTNKSPGVLTWTHWNINAAPKWLFVSRFSHTYASFAYDAFSCFIFDFFSSFFVLKIFRVSASFIDVLSGKICKCCNENVSMPLSCAHLQGVGCWINIVVTVDI